MATGHRPLQQVSDRLPLFPLLLSLFFPAFFFIREEGGVEAKFMFVRLFVCFWILGVYLWFFLCFCQLFHYLLGHFYLVIYLFESIFIGSSFVLCPLSFHTKIRSCICQLFIGLLFSLNSFVCLLQYYSSLIRCWKLRPAVLLLVKGKRELCAVLYRRSVR